MVALQSWLMEVQKFWQALTDSQREGLVIVAAILGALVVGKIVGSIVKLLAKSFGLNEILSLPWSQTSSQKSKTPSDAVGYLCVATIWAGFIWWLAVRYHLTEIANATRFIVGRVWILATVLGLAIGFTNWLVKMSLEILRSQTVRELTEKFLPQTRNHISEAIAKALAFLLYALVFLLTLTIASDILGAQATANALKHFWELSFRLLIAAMAFGFGWLAVRWLEKQIKTATVEPEPTKSYSQIVNLGTMSIVALLVVALLTNGSGLLIAILLIAVIAFLLSPIRDYIPDLWAGLMLKLHNVRQIVVDEKEMKLRRIGPLASELGSEETELVKPNREVLESFLRLAKDRPKVD